MAMRTTAPGQGVGIQGGAAGGAPAKDGRKEREMRRIWRVMRKRFGLASGELNRRPSRRWYMMRWGLGLVFLLLTVGAPVQTQAAPPTGPANDNFQKAVRIESIPFSTVQSTDGATVQRDEPSPCGGISSTVWFEFTPTESRAVDFTTFGSNYDTVLAVYTGDRLRALTVVDCNDDSSSLQSSLRLALTAGVTYRVQAGGFFGDTGNLQLNVDSAAAPPAQPNDNFADPFPVTSNPFTDMRSTHGYTKEPGEPDPSCAPIGATVWYSFTPASTGTVEADTVGSDFDTVIGVYTGTSLADLVEVTCHDDIVFPASTQSVVSFQNQPGVTYFFQVGGFRGQSFFGEMGNLDFSIQQTGV